MQSVDLSVNILRSFAQNSSYEYSSTINFSEGKYYSLVNFGSTLTVTTNLSSSLVGCIYSENTTIIAHTHPKGTLSSPSPSDAILLVNIFNEGSMNIFCNLVIAADGSEYIVYVYNRSDFTDFCNTNQNTNFNIRNGSFFNSESISDIEYKTVYNNLLSKGYSQSIANSFALSYVLDKYNTGIKIAKRNSPIHEFKEQKTNLINNQYQPLECP